MVTKTMFQAIFDPRSSIVKWFSIIAFPVCQLHVNMELELSEYQKIVPFQCLICCKKGLIVL